MSLFDKFMLPQDKANHYVDAALISMVAILIWVAFKGPKDLYGIPLDRGYIGLYAGTLVAVAKDVIWDKLMKRGDFDPKDVLASVAGAATVTAAAAAVTMVR